MTLNSVTIDQSCDAALSCRKQIETGGRSEGRATRGNLVGGAEQKSLGTHTAHWPKSSAVLWDISCWQAYYRNMGPSLQALCFHIFRVMIMCGNCFWTFIICYMFFMRFDGALLVCMKSQLTLLLIINLLWLGATLRRGHLLFWDFLGSSAASIKYAITIHSI